MKFYFARGAGSLSPHIVWARPKVREAIAAEERGVAVELEGAQS